MDLKFGDSHEMLERRLLEVEKMLKFTNVQADDDKIHKVENRLRRDMDQFFLPTQRRCLEL